MISFEILKQAVGKLESNAGKTFIKELKTAGGLSEKEVNELMSMLTGKEKTVSHFSKIFSDFKIKPTILERTPKEDKLITEGIEKESLLTRLCKIFKKNRSTKTSSQVENKKVYTSKAEPFPEAKTRDANYVCTKEGEVLGRCSYVNQIQTDSSLNERYPESWIDPKTNCPKSYIYVREIETPRATRGQGNGREIMKRLYLQSVENGHEGRIRLLAVRGSGGFYDKLGFEVSQETRNDLKRWLERLKTAKKDRRLNDTRCKTWEEVDKLIDTLENQLATHIPCGMGFLSFTPTEENLAKLFAK